MIWCFYSNGFSNISLLSKHIVLNSSWKGRPFILKTPSFVVLCSITPVFCGPILCLCLCLLPHFVLLFVAPLCVVNLLFKRQFMQLLCKAYCVDRPQSLSSTTNVEIRIYWDQFGFYTYQPISDGVYYTLYTIQWIASLCFLDWWSRLSMLPWLIHFAEWIYNPYSSTYLKQMIHFNQP